MRLETTLLDRFISGSFAGKRVIGSPLKYNIKTKGRAGWIELVFHPQGRVEEVLSSALRFIHPYLFYVTLRFHAEKAREGGKSHLNLKLSDSAAKTVFSRSKSGFL